MEDSRPYLIGIAGPSGAGKSTLAHRVAGALGAPILSLDSYYRELGGLPLEERARMNFDEPAALDHDLLIAQVELLAEGREIAVPLYDFSCHTRAADSVRVVPGPFVIVEGLFALYWSEIRALTGTKVYVAAEDEICFGRRLERDVRERGRTPDSVICQYRSTVRPMAERYVWPTRAHADVVVGGTDLLEHSTRQVLSHVEVGRAGRLESAFKALAG